MRSALDELGHETFVLARPTRAKNISPSFVDHSGVWDQPGVTDASAYRIPAASWSRGGASTSSSSRSSTRTTSSSRSRRCATPASRPSGASSGSSSRREHVEPAKRALETVYSLTACERERYATMGIDSPRVRWGIHPELLSYAERDAERRTADVLLSGRLPEQAQARRRGAQGLSPLRRPEREAGDQGSGRARAGDARARQAPSATRGSRWCWTTCRPTSTCACSPPPTSASRPAAGRASDCTCTSRWPSGCR